MKKTQLLCGAFLPFLAFFCTELLGQDSLGLVMRFPDMIVHNGKIITMNDATFAPTVGTIAQAMAVRDGKILKVGANEEVLALAGPGTKLLDLAGRTVIPGLIDVHNHFESWATSRFGEELGTLTGSTRGNSEAETLESLKTVLPQLVARAKPDQFIRVNLPFEAGPSHGTTLVLKGVINRKLLDSLAPNHPVQVVDYAANVVNTKALNMITQKVPYIANTTDEDRILMGVEFGSVLQTHLSLEGKDEIYTDINRRMLQEYPPYGVTTIGNRTYSTNSLKAWSTLDRQGQLPVRVAWSHEMGFLFTPPGFYKIYGDILGYGSDHLWNIGVGREGVDVGTNFGFCSDIPRGDPTYNAWFVETKFMKRACFILPENATSKHNQDARTIFVEAVAAGHRLVDIHGTADKTIDAVFGLIEEGMKQGSLTVEDIRQKHFSLEHLIAVRRDQIAKMKEYGIVAAPTWNYYGWRERVGKKFYEFDGQKYLYLPIKSFLEGGVKTAVGFDLNYTNTYNPWVGLQQFQSRDSYAFPQENVDRATALKLLTTWPADYVMRADRLGSLEAGKWADFLVLSKDYMTVPVEEISTIRPLLTVVGGKTQYQAPDFAY